MSLVSISLHVYKDIQNQMSSYTPPRSQKNAVCQVWGHKIAHTGTRPRKLLAPAKLYAVQHCSPCEAKVTVHSISILHSTPYMPYAPQILIASTPANCSVHLTVLTNASMGTIVSAILSVSLAA